MSDLNDRKDKSLVARALELLGEEYESNPGFNEYFDGDDPPTMIGQGSYNRSQVLFWLDREAYEEARAQWANNSLLERHQDAMALLEANTQLTTFLDLVEAVKRQRIVPFVGAGISKPMGMPLWKEALRQLHDKIHSPNVNVEVMRLIDQGQLLEAAQELYIDNKYQADAFIKTVYRVQNLTGPIRTLPRIAHGCIVTTNFDNAIEKTFTNDKAFDGHMYGKEEHNFFPRLVRGQRCLLKLHGDADNPKTYVLSKSQYEAAYGGAEFNFQLPLPRALRQIFISNSLLFLGCSLEKDWTLDLFSKVREQSEYEIPTHYAVLAEPQTPEGKHEKENFLLALNIQPIWYPTDEHAYVEQLLQLAADAADGRISLGG